MGGNIREMRGKELSLFQDPDSQMRGRRERRAKIGGANERIGLRGSALGKGKVDFLFFNHSMTGSDQRCLLSSGVSHDQQT